MRTDAPTTWSQPTYEPFELSLLSAHCILLLLPTAEPTSMLPFPSPTQPQVPQWAPRQPESIARQPSSATINRQRLPPRVTPSADLPSLQQNVSLLSAQTAFPFHF